MWNSPKVKISIRFSIRVLYNLPKDGQKQDFGVCVKYISVPQDISTKLAEWYETLRAFGVSYIYHPVAEVHPNTAKVLTNNLSYPSNSNLLCC